MAGRAERVRHAIADASIAQAALCDLAAELERERDDALEKVAELEQELKEERDRLRCGGCGNDLTCPVCEPFE
jgi:hypothetical protein